MGNYEVLQKNIREEYSRVETLKESPRSHITLLRHVETGKPVILRELTGEVEVYRRLSQVNCIHLPRVLEAEEKDGQVIVLEEYIQGDNLGDLLAGGLFSENETRQTAKEILAGLRVLHSLGVVHRDVKPENVILRESGAVLIDFDASRIHKESQRSDTHILGTTGYAAPEQFGVAQTDERADIYAMGVLMNMMRTGQHPSKTMAEGRLGKIISKCTMMDPEKRYRNVEQLSRALEKKRYAALLTLVLCLLAGGVLGTRYLTSDPIAPVEEAVPPAVVSAEPEPMTAPEAAIQPSPSPVPEEITPAAEAVYTDGEGTYRLFLCFDAGMIGQHISQAERAVALPPETRTGCPSILTVYREGSSQDVTEAFAQKVREYSVEAIPLGDGTPMEVIETEISPEFEGAYRMVTISMWTQNRENEIRWRLTMEDGQEILLAQRLTVEEGDTVLITPENVDMNTLEQLQQVIDFAGNDAAPGTTIDIYLPPVTYEGDLNIRYRGVNLYGSQEGTALKGSITVEVPISERVNLQDIALEGQGGSGVSAHAPVGLYGCSLSGYEIGAAAYDGGSITAKYSSFVGNGVGIYLDSQNAGHTDVGYDGCLFEGNAVAVQILAVDSDGTMIFPGATFAGNGRDILNEIDYPVDMSEAVIQ